MWKCVAVHWESVVHIKVGWFELKCWVLCAVKYIPVNPLLKTIKGTYLPCAGNFTLLKRLNSFSMNKYFSHRVMQNIDSVIYFWKFKMTINFEILFSTKYFSILNFCTRALIGVNRRSLSFLTLDFMTV